MTDHVFKVGDKGKTRCGYDYEVTGTCKRGIVVEYKGEEFIYGVTGTSPFLQSADLTPPKRRIQGWYGVLPNGKMCGPYAMKHAKSEDLEPYVAGIEIDIEEGEGLNDDN